MNPFTPTFGIVPAQLAGRNAFLSQMHKAFENGIGDPNLSSIIIGPRGSGKTALLSCVGTEAMQCGWLVVSTTASNGMLEDILERTASASAGLFSQHSRRKLTGMTIGQFIGLEWSVEQPTVANWRTRMTQLLDALDKHHVGLLITVDEVRADVDEMIALASIYQLFIREGHNVGLVMAGLSGHVNDLIHDKSVSFLRRSRQQVLDRISDAEIEQAFRKTIENEGKTITKKALDKAVYASAGYAYMMQLVGYWIWEASGSAKRISETSADRGILTAEKEFRNGVLNSTYRECSAGDRNFLFAMLEDDDTSSLTQIADRLGKSTGYASTYKSRLLKSGIIEEMPDHTFQFALPAFRSYLADIR